MLRGFRTLKRSDRLRAIGWLILVAGLLSSAVLYLVETMAADAVLNDTNALGYSRSMQQQVGEMMGHFGLMLTDWQNMLTSPPGEALVIAVCAALLAAYFFRVAWVIDQEQQN
jgi:hypothetical protein